MNKYALLSNTRRVPVDGKSSVCLSCMKYRIIILIIVIISLGQILLSYIADTSRTHARTCMREHRPPLYRLAPFVGAQPWRPAPLAFIAGSRVIQINTRAGHSISPRFWMFFAYKKNARPNWDANSRQGVLSVDTNSLRHLPRRSSKNCDLPFANADRQT